jgi:hypothetical protein
MLARGGKQDFAVHFGDEIELGDPGVELHVAETAAQSFAHIGPDNRNLAGA